MIGKERNFGLDLIRVISIILVLISHSTEVPYELGTVGVQFFFVLSGFLIGQILIRDLNDGSNGTKMMNFWKRRWWRTLPLYYLILTLKIWFYGNPYGWKMIVYFLFLQANIIGIKFFGVSWTLVVEEWFYIFLPIAFFFFFRTGIEPRKFFYFLVGLIVFFLCTRFLWNYFEKGVILYQFDCLLLGVFLAALKIYYNLAYLKISTPLYLFFGLSGIMILTLSFGKLSEADLFDTYRRVIWYFLISFCIALTIPFIEVSAFVNRKVKSVKPIYIFITWTSILTYSIYLVHMDVLKFARYWSPHFGTAVGILLIYLVSMLLFLVYEYPMMSLREKFSLYQYWKNVRSIRSFNKDLNKFQTGHLPQDPPL